MVQTKEELKAKKRKYDQEYNKRPERKAKRNERTSRPEVRAKKKEYDKIHRIEYSQRPEVVARRRELASRPEVKAKNRERTSRPENKVRRSEYNSRPERKAKNRERSSRPENKLKDKEYASRPEVVARRRELASRPEVKVKKNVEEKKRRKIWKLKTFSVYSKRHSNSEIPCCRCCGQNSHIDFLTIDHIDGRKNLPKEQQNLKAHGLISWLTRNNYPEGHQILCWNCNVAKGDKECPHLEMRK